MAEFQLIMPKMGESIAEATVIRWLKEEGEAIEADESVLEIATDKVDSEVPSPKGGILKKKLYGENDVVKVGEPVAIIELEGEAGAEAAPAPAAEAPVANANPVAVAEKMVSEAKEATTTAPSNSEGSRFYSPLVLNIARTEGISMTELEALSGTGNEGRVTKKDILAYVKDKQSGKVSAPVAAPVSTPAAPVSQPKVSEPSAPAVSMNAGDEIIEMDRMRKIISDHMVMSKRTSPHVTSFVEADVTNMVLWRDKVKDAFFKREGEKITFTPIFIEAVTKAIKDFPMINISVDGDKIIKRKDINVGMATALPSGNLIVPVIKNADQKNLLGLTKDVNNLANKARANKLSPDDIQGGTYTLTNVGGFGNVMGTPIINQPQVAILAVGAIKKKPAVIETPQGDMIGIRHFMYLSHSYDHRVVDGALGGMFVRRVADYLEQWDINREI
ncbi:MAG: 2-oxo acid dehydrogenase subunit E2 [Bacteroidetes bacterium]|nr:MAG: 2-oxo acid dehydrogenase subunit E2 [Bacteroidota bacterium]